MSRITYATVYTQGLTDEAVAEAFDARLRELTAGPPIECQHLIGGERHRIGARFEREDPTQPDHTVAHGYEGGGEAIDLAVRAARDAWQEWGRTSVAERCALMREAASRFAERRVELAALMSYEIGKARADSLAEIDECGVILDLYAKQMEESHGFNAPLEPPVPGSKSEAVYVPYGVFGIVLPFNFPMALATGMVAAALITGNTVVYKPSALTPASGDAWTELFSELLSPGVLNTVQGDATTGRALVDSSVDGVGFTGSAQVGLQMAQRLAQPPYIRPLVAEMGGKNPSIVTGSAGDLKAAAEATARSAFGLSGQKCVSCSRAIVTADVHDEFVDALVEYTATLQVGVPLDRTTFTGPVIKPAALERFREASELARRDGRIAVGGNASEPGYFADLTVVTDLPNGHPLTRRELFVPFLAVTKVDDVDDAISEANEVEYGLSSGIFTDDPGEQERFLNGIQAGIAFVNNPGGATTGIWPGNQTMAGWKATGSTGKGGFGPYYLLQYLHEQSRTIYGSMA